MAQEVTKASGKTALLMGMGYCARAVLHPLQQAGYTVFATTRKAEHIKIYESWGVNPLLFTGHLNVEMTEVLRRTHVLLSSIPPIAGRDPLTAKAVITPQHTPHLMWAGYLSATSVYGDTGGDWVDEHSPVQPHTARGRARASAELDWLESGFPVHIFRLAGIYGPDVLGLQRNPFSRLRTAQARAVIKAGHRVNRIHVTDIAQAVMASIAKPTPLSIYNLSDGAPIAPHLVLEYSARLIGAPLPPRVDHAQAKMSDMARSFYQETKCVSAEKAQKELNWAPKFSNYRQGLMAIAKSETPHPIRVWLSGYIDLPIENTAALKRELDNHVTHSRAEPGCQRFDVLPDLDSPNRFHVFEVFENPQAFQFHQNRTRASIWGQMSQNIRHDYDVIDL